MHESVSFSSVVDVPDGREVALTHDFEVSLALGHSSPETFDFGKEQHERHAGLLVLLLEGDVVGIAQP